MAYSRCLIMRNKPRIRFKGFTEDWEQRKFVDLLDPQNGIRRGPFGSSLKKDSFVKKSDYVVYEQQNAIYDNYETRYFISREKYNELIRFNIQPGDFIMSGAGTIGRISMVPDGIKKGVFNQALIRFKVNKDSVDPLYFLKFMQSDMMQKQLTQANPGSAMTNLVPMDELKKWNIVIPSFEEQNRISTFIKQTDDVITLHQRKLEKLKLAKKALLQKLFPKNGSQFPEIRFKDFTDAWEQCKLGDLLILLKDGSHGTHKNTSEGVYLLSAKNIKNGRINIMPDDRIISWDDYNVIHKSYELQSGDILLTIVGSIGETAIYNLKTKVTFQRSVAFLRPNSKLKNGFLYTLINTDRFQNQLQTKQVVSAQPGIYLGDLASINITYPKNVLEQEKIYNIFKGIENSITLHQRKLDKLQEVKKGLLQKMFV